MSPISTAAAPVRFSPTCWSIRKIIPERGAVIRYCDSFFRSIPSRLVALLDHLSGMNGDRKDSCSLHTVQGHHTPIWLDTARASDTVGQSESGEQRKMRAKNTRQHSVSAHIMLRIGCAGFWAADAGPK